MADPLSEQSDVHDAMRLVVRTASAYLESLPERLVYDTANEPLLAQVGGPLPEEGLGTLEAVSRLLEVGTATASTGPPLLPLRHR
jgi:hypothetical protein